MTKMTLITMTTVSSENTFTNTDFAVGFGHALAALPVGVPMTAKQICDAICPEFTVQKTTAYLKMAVIHGIMKREEVELDKTWEDYYGNRHVWVQALYTRV